MLTCLCDAFYGEVGIATVKVLEHVGCTVHFESKQTCCGQPPFNAGDWDKARPVAQRCADLFEGDRPVVVPSASCAAMVRDGFGMLKVENAPKTFELCEFLHQMVHVESWPSLPQPLTAVLHRSCHGRVLNLGDTQEQILGLIPNLNLLSPQQADQCCGFGGAFSVTHQATSVEIGTTKLDQLVNSGATTVIGGDMGCFLHLEGLAQRQKRKLEFKHIAEVLASAL